MWLCLKMRLFYLNPLTSFNPAIRVWGFSSGFPHTRGPAWARSANELMSVSSELPCVRHGRAMNIFLMAFPVTALPQAALLARGYCFTGSQLWKTGMFCVKVVLRGIKNLSAHSTALHHQGLDYVMDLKAGISPDFFFPCTINSLALHRGWQTHLGFLGSEGIMQSRLQLSCS